MSYVTVILFVYPLLFQQDRSSTMCLVKCRSATRYASKKSGDRITEVLFNEGFEDDLIPESVSTKSSDSERPESPDTALISDVADQATPETSPRYLLSTSSTIYSKHRPEYRHSEH
jgi:hypothetical protein